MNTPRIRLAVLLALCAAAPARAALVDWNIDSASSYVRLTVPDSQIVLDVIGTPTLRIRDLGSTTTWTDAGGRRATLAGTLRTDVAGGLTPTAIAFLPGGNTIQAVDDKLLRPAPDTWNGTDFAAEETALAALGGRLRGTVQTLFNFDAAFFALSQLAFDITGGGTLIANGLPGGSTSFTSAFGLMAVDGQYISFGGVELGNGLGAAPALGGVNNGAVALQNLGGDQWQLTYSINMPIQLQFEPLGASLNGTAAGQIVAFATLAVPEPSSIVLAGFAALGICRFGRHRLRRSA